MLTISNESKVVEVDERTLLLIDDIPLPTERQLRFKGKKCTRCGRMFHPNVGTQPTCLACHYVVKCDYCHEWFVPKPAKMITPLGENESIYCCKSHGDSHKMQRINAKRIIAAEERLIMLQNGKKEIARHLLSNGVSLVLFDISPYLVDTGYNGKYCGICSRMFIPSNQKQMNCTCCEYQYPCSHCGKVLHSQSMPVNLKDTLCNVCQPKLHMIQFNQYRKEHGLGVFSKEWQQEFGSKGRVKLNFVVKNGVELALDHSTGEYVPKKELFDRFQNKLNKVEVSDEIQCFLDDGFVLEPIVKIDDETWNRPQTDQMLHEKGYRWFVYIKLFHGHPFIVGKTGTYDSMYRDGTTKSSSVDFDFLVRNVMDEKDPSYAGQGSHFCP